jgi:hypothetical protein
MTSKEFQSAKNGTKVQIELNGDSAMGIIVKRQEYNSRGTLISFNAVKFTDAPSDSRFAKLVKRGPQNGIRSDILTVAN